MADAQCWEATFTLKMLSFFSESLASKTLKLNCTKTLLCVAQKQLCCGKAVMPAAQLLATFVL